jgi:hypothetical protein
MRHLLLYLEIAGVSQPFDDEIDLLSTGGVNRKSRMRCDFDGGQMGHTGPNQINSTTKINQTTGFLRIVHHSDDNRPKEFN